MISSKYYDILGSKNIPFYGRNDIFHGEHDLVSTMLPRNDSALSIVT
jgi:hypothetical protein